MESSLQLLRVTLANSLKENGDLSYTAARMDSTENLKELGSGFSQSSLQMTMQPARP